MNHDRKWLFYTGEKGHQMLNDIFTIEMLKSINLNAIDSLFKKNKINKDKHSLLLEMANSADIENLYLLDVITDKILENE